MIVFLIRVYFILGVLFATILLRTRRYVQDLLFRGVIDLRGWGSCKMLSVASMQIPHMNVI